MKGLFRRYFFCLLTAFLINNIKVANSQSIQNPITNQIWTSTEGIEFQIKGDSTIGMGSIGGKILLITDSSIFTTIYSDTLLYANYKHLGDSILINFQFKRLKNNKPHVLYQDDFGVLFKSSLPAGIIFYSEDLYKKLPPINNFESFKYNNLVEINEDGTILINTEKRILFYGRQLCGVYRGKLNESDFNSFKRRLELIEFYNKAHKIKDYRPPYDSQSGSYKSETKNSKVSYDAGYFVENNIKISFFPLIFSDSAWINNQMRYYGLDEKNGQPMKQIYYKSKCDINSSRLFAISGIVDSLERIKTQKREGFLYQIKIDSVYHQKEEYLIGKSIFFLSNDPINLRNKKMGLVLKNAKPIWTTKLDTDELIRVGYYDYIDKFKVDSVSLLFDFFSSRFYRPYYRPEIRPRPAVGSIPEITQFEFKLSKAIRRIKNQEE